MLSKDWSSDLCSADLIGGDPASDGINGTGDCAVIFGDRGLVPEGVASLMFKPMTKIEIDGLKPFKPALPPSVRAGDLRVRRLALDRPEQCAPVEHVMQ